MLDYKKCSDEQLALLIGKHDKEAFAEIYDRFSGLMYIYGQKITKNQEEAEDLIQDVFISLWDKRSTFKLTTSLSNYLYSSLRYKYLDLVARKKIRADYMDSFQLFLDQQKNVTEDYLNEKELLHLIEQEVANLPIKMREIFELSRNVGLSHREIAIHLNLSEKTVKNQVNNALKVLRTKLNTVTFLMLFF